MSTLLFLPRLVQFRLLCPILLASIVSCGSEAETQPQQGVDASTESFEATTQESSPSADQYAEEEELPVKDSAAEDSVAPLCSGDAGALRFRLSEDFSHQQGEKGWRYQEYDGTEFKDMSWDEQQQRWQGSYPYCLISNGALHPQTNQAVVSWSAPWDGDVTVQAMIERESTEGDGTRVRILKNNEQVWPSEGWQTLVPAFVAFQSAVISVQAGDVLRFLVDACGTDTNNCHADYSHDSTVWDPEIRYCAQPKFTTDKTTFVVPDLHALDINYMDVSLSTLYQGPGKDNRWLHSGPGPVHQILQGPLDAPGKAVVQKYSSAEYFTNFGADDKSKGWWLTNVYQHEDGSCLGFIHVELLPKPRIFRLGLAYSAHCSPPWNYLGDIVHQHGETPGTEPREHNITGTPYLVLGEYIYIYYKDLDYEKNGDPHITAVARAPLAEVLAAAKGGDLEPWRKYYEGQWNESGLGGRATDLDTQCASLHSDAAHNPTRGINVLTGLYPATTRGVWIAFSKDGLQWSKGDFLQLTHKASSSLAPYVTLVNEDGTDNGVVGDTFYAYWGFNPNESNKSELRRIARQKITLVNP